MVSLSRKIDVISTDNSNQVLTIRAPETGRLDKVMLCFPSESGPVSRSQIQQWIRQGWVKVEGISQLKAGMKVEQGQIIQVSFPARSQSFSKKVGEKPSILFEDQWLIVIDKPAGLLVHPGAGRKNEYTLVDALSEYGLEKHFTKSDRPGIVHRLDKDTSGALVVAKDVTTLEALSRLFAERHVYKEYLALAITTPRRRGMFDIADEGVIDKPIGRDARARVKMAIDGVGAKEARTRWTVIERMKHARLLKLVLETGRTHQIRVHCAAESAPLVGDPVYKESLQLPGGLSRAIKIFGRQALHAHVIEFTHPFNDTRVNVEAPIPEDFLSLLTTFREE